jgi:hypothetical protein
VLQGGHGSSHPLFDFDGYYWATSDAQSRRCQGDRRRTAALHHECNELPDCTFGVSGRIEMPVTPRRGAAQKYRICDSFPSAENAMIAVAALITILLLDSLSVRGRA